METEQKVQEAVLIAEIRTQLQELAEPEYREFQAGLLPGVTGILGVRTPKLRAMAKALARRDWRSYVQPELPTYEECMLQGLVLGYARMEDEERRSWLERFVPRMNNWAVCDCCTSTYKFVAKDLDGWYPFLKKQLAVGTEYSIRFAVVALMDYYVQEAWIDRVLAVYDSISHEGYYVKMAVAWAISVCYVAFPEKTEAFLRDNHLDDFTQNKAIQKIRESYRVSREKKELLNCLKRPGKKQTKGREQT